MHEAYCLKSCADCGQCGGCFVGACAARCGIAKCCKEKNHESCESCTRFDGCRLRMSRDAMPEKLHEEDRRAEQQRQASLARAGLLGKWCMVAFWLMIAQIAVGFVGLIPALELAAETAALVLGVGGCYAYLRMKEADEGFVTVAGLELAALVTVYAGYFVREGSVPGFILNMITIAVGGVLMWKKCDTIRFALGGISTEYAEKWQNQWVLFRTAMYVMLGSIILAFIPGIGILAVLGLLVGACLLLFVVIREVVYIYQTARVCRSFAVWQ